MIKIVEFGIISNLVLIVTRPEMEVSIDLISNDVLLEVFEYLDGKSLKTAALVCKK